MSLNFKKITLMIISSLLGVGLALIIFKQMQYPDTPRPMESITQVLTKKTDATIIFHKSGCADCEAVKELMKQTIKANKDEVNYIVVDLKKAEYRGLIQKFDLVSTPTIIQIHHGVEMRRYAGTDHNLIQSILSKTEDGTE